MKGLFRRGISVLSVAILGFTVFSYDINTTGIDAAAEDDKYIALTFDDGPNTTTTNEILDLLEMYDAKASFFLIGDNINEESAVTVKRAYDMGCEINNHSKTHSNMGGMSDEEMLEEINYVNEQVYEITGEYPKFFRPPFIDTSEKMYEVIDLPFICGFDCKDYMENVTAQNRYDAIISAAKDGLIVLLHDAAGNDQTVEALKTIIPELQSQGYKFVTLTELFEAQGETPRGDIIYSEVAKYPCTAYKLHKQIFSGEATGESGWSGWGETAVFDIAELEELGESYAIEIDYSGINPPVLALQAWSNGSFWQTVMPAYYNGERACIMAADVIKALESNDMSYSNLDKLSIMPFGGEMTVTRVDILVKNGDEAVETILTELADCVLDKIPPEKEYDVNGDGVVDCFDVVAERQRCISAS